MNLCNKLPSAGIGLVWCKYAEPSFLDIFRKNSGFFCEVDYGEIKLKMAKASVWADDWYISHRSIICFVLTESMEKFVQRIARSL